MGIDRSPSSVYAISHRPGYGAWVISGIGGTPSGAMPAAAKVKIGHTSNLHKRIGSITRGGLDRGDLRIEFERRYRTARQAKATEERLHFRFGRFGRKVLGNEWFRLSAIDIEAIPALVEFFDAVGTAHALTNGPVT